MKKNFSREKKINRRKFLKTGAGAVSSAVVGSFTLAHRVKGMDLKSEAGHKKIIGIQILNTLIEFKLI